MECSGVRLFCITPVEAGLLCNQEGKFYGSRGRTRKKEPDSTCQLGHPDGSKESGAFLGVIMDLQIHTFSGMLKYSTKVLLAPGHLRGAHFRLPLYTSRISDEGSMTHSTV